jgi:hypothetical protein
MAQVARFFHSSLYPAAGGRLGLRVWRFSLFGAMKFQHNDAVFARNPLADCEQQRRGIAERPRPSVAP